MLLVECLQKDLGDWFTGQGKGLFCSSSFISVLVGTPESKLWYFNSEVVLSNKVLRKLIKFSLNTRSVSPSHNCISYFLNCQMWNYFYVVYLGKWNSILSNKLGCVARGFKNKTQYTPYVSPESQISHIATNKCNINRQCLIYNILVYRI